METQFNNDQTLSDNLKTQMVLTSAVAIAALLIYQKTVEDKLKSKKLGNVS